MMMRMMIALTLVPFSSALDLEALPSAVGLNPSALSAYTEFLQHQLDNFDIPFVDAMIVKNGKLVYQFQDSSHHVNATITDDSIYELFSATKILTTLGVMICYDRGLLHLNDPLSRFIPEFRDATVYVSGGPEDMQTRPAKYSPTIRHLLTHTSGIIGYGLSAKQFLGTDVHPVEAKKAMNGDLLVGFFGPGMDAFIEKYPTLESFVASEAKNYPLLFEPGTAFHYSHAHTHAARVVEVVTGMHFGEFMRQNLFDPLEMTSTGWATDCTSEHKLPVYAPDMTKMRPSTFEGNGFLSPGATPGCMPAAAALGPAMNLHCHSTALLDHGVFYFADAQGVGSAKDWVNVAKMLSPSGGGRGTFKGKRILSPRTCELMWQNHLPALDLGSPWLDGDAMSTIGLKFEAGPGVGFGLGGTVIVDPTLAGSIKSKGTWGWEGAANTKFYYDPEEDLAMIFFTQKFFSGFDRKYNSAGGNGEWQRLIYSALGATEGTCAA